MVHVHKVRGQRSDRHGSTFLHLYILTTHYCRTRHIHYICICILHTYVAGVKNGGRQAAAVEKSCTEFAGEEGA